MKNKNKSCPGCTKKFASFSGRKRHITVHHPELLDISQESWERRMLIIKRNQRRAKFVRPTVVNRSPLRMMAEDPPAESVAGHPPSDDLSLSPMDMNIDLDAQVFSPVTPSPPDLGPPSMSKSQMDVLQRYVIENPSLDYSSHQENLERVLGRKLEKIEFHAVSFALGFLQHCIDSAAPTNASVVRNLRTEFETPTSSSMPHELDDIEDLFMPTPRIPTPGPMLINWSGYQ